MRLKLFKILFGLILFSSEIFACSVGKESGYIQAKQARTYELIALSFVLFTATIYFYFKKNRKGVLSICISFIFIGVAFLMSDADIGDCGFGAVKNAELSVLITFICFSFQFFTWLFRRKKANAELP